ncbi:MAG: hypothetical protein ACJA0N_002807 [Pseudohongiellaceae bacterium]|jgi:hypothetical protein
MLVSKNRNEVTIKAYKSGGYSLKEVGLFFGLHYVAVSRIAGDAKGNNLLLVGS